MSGGDPDPVLLGLRDGLGVPGLTLAAAYTGLGVSAHAQGLPLAETVASTVFAFSISGQAAFFHAAASSTPLLPLGAAVLAANVRLLPLAAAVAARIRRLDGPPGWLTLAVALLTGATAWGAVMRRADRLPQHAVAAYALAVAAVLWLVSAAGTAAGWLLLGAVPPALAAGLAFLSAAYFAILMAAEAAKGRARVLAVLAGAALAPALSADLGAWAVVAAGLAGAAASVAWSEVEAARAAAAPSAAAPTGARAG